MSDLQEHKFPMRCLCGGYYRLPTLADAVIGTVRCSKCVGKRALLEEDRRSAVDRATKETLRAAGVEVKS